MTFKINCCGRDLVRLWTGLEGKALGAAMAGFRASMGHLDERAWVDFRLMVDEDIIKELFLDFYRKWGKIEL